LQPNHPTRNAQGSVSGGLAAVRAEAALTSPVRFPGEDGGRTLAEMAQRDLDAALQLLADRAQFITGASGAAIALRRDGRNDMLCRASAGSNAPELGALLSTEFGLSGESVRTRQLLRCDDAARDARVNQDACRRLGIASVVVMPVVNDDEVLGVFELFSGQANAFGDRDLSAVQRLTEMVETAVRLANASLSLPQQLEIAQVPAAAHGDALEKKSVAEKIEETSGEILDEDILLDALETPTVTPQSTIDGAGSQSSLSLASPSSVDPDADEIIETTPASPPKDAPAKPSAELTAGGASGSGTGQAVAGKAGAEVEVGQKPLFWSAAMNAEAESGKAGEIDQSNVPPVLRGLRKCEACGFPISGGRTLCVECEEKKWRGQLKKPGAMTMGAIPGVASPKPEGQAFAAAAQSIASASSSAPVLGYASASVVQPAATAQRKEQPEDRPAVKSATPEAIPPVISTAAESPAPELVLSAGLEPSQSWLARNKYIVGVLLAVAAAVTAAFLLR
jgi:GAF domain-containing protein